MGVTRKQLASLIKAQLVTITGVSGYRGQPPKTPPTLAPDDMRVKPYWVLHTGAGAPDDERLGGEIAGIAYTFSVTAAVGVEDHLDQLVDDIHAVLSGWRPDPSTSRCWPPFGLEVGPPRIDDGKTPPRFWLPLPFVIYT